MVSSRARRVVKLLYLPDKILRKVAEVVGPRYICMSEEVLIWVFRVVAVSKKELEEVEEPNPIQTLYGTLNSPLLI